MKLPIQVILNTDPPRFRWTTQEGIETEGLVPPYLESALMELIDLAEKKCREVDCLVKENLILNEQLDKLRQSKPREITVTNPSSSSKKSKG